VNPRCAPGNASIGNCWCDRAALGGRFGAVSDSPLSIGSFLRERRCLGQSSVVGRHSKSNRVSDLDCSALTDWLDIVDAAYDVQEPSQQRWLKRLLEAIAAKLGSAHPALGALFHFPSSGALQIFLHESTPAGFLKGVERVAQHEEAMTRALYGRVPFATLSMRLGRAPLMQSEAVQSSFHSLGIYDMIALIARDPGPWGVNISLPLAKPERISSARAAPWGRVAAHVHAGLRLRLGVYGEPTLAAPTSLVALHGGIEAVLNDDGKLQHAEPSALDGRERLREAARTITRARTHTRRQDADNALLEWQSLVEGKWTLVDHFDSDGRRYLVARRNPPGGEHHSGLTLDEARAAGFRAMGHPLKLIAYELGFSIPAVSRLLRGAARKLGLKSGSEFAHLASAREEH